MLKKYLNSLKLNQILKMIIKCLVKMSCLYDIIFRISYKKLILCVKMRKM